MTDGIAGPLKPFTSAIKEGWGGGRALPLERAALRVGSLEMESPVASGDGCVAFVADLPAGEARLQTYLTDDDGTTLGAYYVYVERLS